MDFLRQPVRLIHIIILLVVLVVIIAGVWVWRQRSAQIEAKRAQQEIIQQRQQEGSPY